MSEPVSGAAAGLLAYKTKALLLGAAALGALAMAISRPPKSRRALLAHGLVALGCSFLFGNTIAQIVDFYAPWIDTATAPHDEVIEFLIAVHGLVGALGWGVMGAIGTLRDKLQDNPQGFVEWVKSLFVK